MAIDLLDSVNSALSGVARQTSTLFGESETNTQSGLRASSSTLLAGLLQGGSDPNRARDIYQAVTSASIDPSIDKKIPALVGDQVHMQGLLGTGETLLAAIFGNRAAGATHALAQVAGVKPSTAASMLAMVAPVLLGFLKKFVTQQRLDANGLSSLLLTQRDSLQKSGLDERITTALGFTRPSHTLGSAGAPLKRVAEDASDTIAEHVPERRRWIPWAIAAGVIALLFGFLFNRSAHRDASSVAQNTTAMRLTTAATSVYFESGQVALDSAGKAALMNVAHAARTTGKAVALTGYTDPTGDEQQNEALAKNRAAVVRLALLQNGVPESQIVMKAPEVVTGSGSDTQARRVDVAPVP